MSGVSFSNHVSQGAFSLSGLVTKERVSCGLLGAAMGFWAAEYLVQRTMNNFIAVMERPGTGTSQSVISATKHVTRGAVGFLQMGKVVSLIVSAVLQIVPSSDS